MLVRRRARDLRLVLLEIEARNGEDEGLQNDSDGQRGRTRKVVDARERAADVSASVEPP